MPLYAIEHKRTGLIEKIRKECDFCDKTWTDLHIIAKFGGRWGGTLKEDYYVHRDCAESALKMVSYYKENPELIQSYFKENLELIQSYYKENPESHELIQSEDIPWFFAEMSRILAYYKKELRARDGSGRIVKF